MFTRFQRVLGELALQKCPLTGGFLLFSLFLQEINSEGPADGRRNPRLLAFLSEKKQRHEGNTLDAVVGYAKTSIKALLG
jgi:hypothetical protein